MEKAPSNIAAIGRYIFTPDIFDSIKKTPPGVNNELQIADSINLLRQKEKVYAFAFSGRRYDIGDRLGYIQAIIDFALQHDDLRAEVAEYLKKIIT